MEWTVILAYVCFGLGALLILVGFVRISWYACVVRQDKKRRDVDYNNFKAHSTDPWLKSNPLVSKRLEVSTRENDSLKDVDVNRFNGIRNGAIRLDDEESLTESQRHGSPKSRSDETNVEHVYHTAPVDGISYGRELRIDSETLSRNAKYEEEENTNLVLAKKNQPPKNLPPMVDAAETTTVDITASNAVDKTEVSAVGNGEAISPRSLDWAKEAIEALDNAMEGEVVATPRSDISEPFHSDAYPIAHNDSRGSSTPTARSVISTKITSGEPLPGDTEMEYDYEHAITAF